LAFHDKEVLPDSFFSKEYRLITDKTENGGDIFYSINKTAHDYGKYLVDNNVFALPEPQAELSAREQAIVDTAPHIPPDRANDIILYQIGSFYEAHGEHADMLASQLGLAVFVVEDKSDPSISFRYIGFPADKLEEYTNTFHENSNRNFTISSELADGTRDITYITHPFWDMTEWEQYVHVVSKDDAGTYTEPFVVIENSESPNFSEMEWLTFNDADMKFKEVEAAENALREADGTTGGYHKTNGVIFYKADPDDTELSTYQFRYDIGSYNGEQSGLLNHIINFWNNVQSNIRQGETAAFTTYSQDDVDNVFRMIEVLENGTQLTVENAIAADESEISETAQYALTYRFLPDPDRLIVRNEIDDDPDILHPIVARYEDGNVVLIDENLPQSVIDEITEYAGKHFSQIKEASEARMQRFVDAVSAINQSSESPEISEPPVILKNEIPVYKDTLRNANENGEREQAIASMRLNTECREAIDRAIIENSTPGAMAGTQYVDTKEAARSVIAEYGSERVAWVLAGNVNANDWDGRISNANKEWARDFNTSVTDVNNLNTHRTILDSLVTRFRELERETPALNVSVEDLDEQHERFEVIVTSDAFPDPEDTYAIWDNETNNYYADDDGVLPTFANEAEAEIFLAELRTNQSDRQTVDIPITPVTATSSHNGTELTAEPEQSDIWYRVGDRVHFNNAEHEIIQIADNGVVATRDNNGGIRWDSAEMFDSLLRTNDINSQLRSERLNPETETQPLREIPAQEMADRINFRITDPHLGEGGAKVKYGYNIEAIKTLQAIESENRLATPEEQAVLSRFVGWGGLQEAFDESKPGWAS